MTPQWCSAGLLAIGYFTFVPLTIGNGTSATLRDIFERRVNEVSPVPKRPRFASSS